MNAMMENLEALDPALRAIGQPEGVSLKLAGQEWLLAHAGVSNRLDAYRDRMDDQVRLQGTVNMGDVIEVAAILLMSNYEIDLAEVVQLIETAERDALTDAVMTAMFGGGSHLTYTDWMLASLYGAGLDPDKIPARWVPVVLDNLVRTGRAVPVDKFTDAGRAGPKLRAKRAAAQAYAEKQAQAAKSDSADLVIPAEELAEILAAKNPEQPS
jgi:hypothetical protein